MAPEQLVPITYTGKGTYSGCLNVHFIVVEPGRGFTLRVRVPRSSMGQGQKQVTFSLLHANL